MTLSTHTTESVCASCLTGKVTEQTLELQQGTQNEEAPSRSAKDYLRGNAGLC